MSLDRRSAIALLGGGISTSALGTGEKPVDSDIFAEPLAHRTAREEEKHNIFLYVLSSFLFRKWSVDRRDTAAYFSRFPGRQFCEYAGHNIAALVVNPRDEIVCFALNQNYRLNSSLEHAEVRAVRRAIGMANTERFKPGIHPSNYDDMLVGYRLYTTVESCSQCSGVLDLANFSAVIYAQEDPGQHHIGNALYNLSASQGAHGAPLPVRATFFPYFGQIATAYADYTALTRSRSVTAFLRSVAAYEIYGQIASEFESYVTAYDPVNQWVLDNGRRCLAASSAACGDGEDGL